MIEKMKVYLDTNMVHDYFVNQARALRQKENAIIPKKFMFMFEEKKRLEYITSFLTKAEIARELVSAHGINLDVVKSTWQGFIEALPCLYVNKFEFDESLVEIALKFPMKLRTLFNFQHLFLAMKLDCYIVSGDENFLNAVKKNLLYDKAISYIELRKIVEEN